MMKISKQKTIFLVLIFLGILGAADISLAADVYVTQNTSGYDTGENCDNAHSASWFNSNATGGNVYHLCGTFAGTDGSTMLTPPSGSAGNILTILFEQDALLVASYWGSASAGAITISNKSYISIDGGINGAIKNTANGTSLANHQTSTGIFINASNNIEIKNLTINNIYVNEGSLSTAIDTDGRETSNIRTGGSLTNVSIHDCTLDNSRSGVRVDFDNDALDTIEIYNNHFTDHAWHISFGAGNGGESTTNILVHDNEFTGWENWTCPAWAAYCYAGVSTWNVGMTYNLNDRVVYNGAYYKSLQNSNTGNTPPNVSWWANLDVYHTDGIIAFGKRGNPFVGSFYNNYFHGSLGDGSATAFIYCTHGGGTSGYGSTCKIYNNLLVETSGKKANWMLSTGGSTTGHEIYNNTLVGQDTTAGIGMMLSGNNIKVKNNIVYNKKLAIASYESLPGAIFASVSDSNNNIFVVQSGNKFSFNDGLVYYDWTQWQALGYDLNSSTSDPSLSASYAPDSDMDPSVNVGADLSSVFTTDKNGVSRPQGAVWDIGAYEYAEIGALQGDLNSDGTVNIFDYNLLLTNFGNATCGNVADINTDCTVNIFDYNIMLTNFGQSG